MKRKIKVIQDKQIESIVVSHINKGFRLPKSGKHKKGFKQICYGLLLVSSIMAGLLLNVSSDANALKYQVDTIPFLVPESPSNNIITNGANSILYEPFRIEYEDSQGNFVPKKYWYALTQPGSGFSECNYHSYHRVDSSGQSVNSNNEYLYSYLSYRLRYYIDDLSYSDVNKEHLAHCNSNGKILDPNLRPGSFPPYTFGNPDGASWIPYRYETSGIYRYMLNDEDGYHAAGKFSLEDLFERTDEHHSVTPPSTVYSLNIPLGARKPSSDLSPGKYVEFHSRFYFDSDIPDQAVFQFANNPTMYLQVRSYPLNFSLPQGQFPCSSSINDNPNPDEAPVYLDVICWGNLPSVDTPEYYGFNLRMQRGSGDEYLWDYEQTRLVIFDIFEVTTDHDSTPASEQFGLPVDGGDTSLSPGYVQTTNDNISWFDSLVNMFTLPKLEDFANPFAPIFGLFTDSSSCAQIPTLAGMLHSNETEVCPWFPANVRQIVTPVLGLSSMMLLFGFFVRWLGASSGNFFEDTSGETLTYSNWYTDGRGFHRTPGSANRRINK